VAKGVTALRCRPRLAAGRRDPASQPDPSPLTRTAGGGNMRSRSWAAASGGWRRSPRLPRAARGTAASAADLAAYVQDYDSGEPKDPDHAEPDEEKDEPDDFFLSDDDDESDDLTMEGLFLPVTSLRQVLDAIDDDERLTALGW
jgi:hypothetical protein